MTTKLLVLVLLSISAIGLASKPENSYGFVGGMSSFNQLIKSSAGVVDDSTSSELGLYVGVYGEKYLSPSWVLTPGIYFSQKGAKTGAASRRANYLETSALLRWYFLDGSKWRSYLGFGGGFGVLLSAEDVTNAGVLADKFSFFSKNELSAQVGWGLEFPVSSDTGMQLGITYSRSMTSFLDPTTVGGDKGTWNGFYGFVALRFKSQKESITTEDRARDYLRWKNGQSAPTGEESES
ncbi:MAG: hypothetical protein EBQ92_02640 [Proteobacteria bacterium]|jgi:hypothetical protein|nr:hypothetical protein [Pseudomonadota bacterium]